MHKVFANILKTQFIVICHYIHDEDHFHHAKILTLDSGLHTEKILNRKKNYNEIYHKMAKTILQRQKFQSQKSSRVTPATNLKIGTYVLIPNFITQKRKSKKLPPIRKEP